MTSGLSIRLLTLLVVVYTCCTVVEVNGEQQFIETPPSYKEVTLGQDVQLPCRVRDKRGECAWQKDRKIVTMRSKKYQMLNDRDNDCTLVIRNVSLDFDDGYWECQVGSSDLMYQDALTSLPSRLLVIVKPKPPTLEYDRSQPIDDALSLKEGQEITIGCSAQNGNPPALIKWFIGDQEIEPLREQQNISESHKTWIAQSLLRLHGRREYHGLWIKCVAIHASSSSQALAKSRINVLYLPEVQIRSNPQPLTAAPEDLESFLGLKCLVDSNPPAEIKWYKGSSPLNDAMLSQLKYNKSQIGADLVQISELRFEPVKKQDAGMYSCKAVNIIGESVPASYSLDVQYKPRVKNIENVAEDDLVKTVQLGSTAEPFVCPEFDANPPAQYRWTHSRRKSTAFTMNGQASSDSRRLRLEHITWSDQGEYTCVAFNTINGVRKETNNKQRYIINVTGPPEIQAKSDHMNNHESIGWIGERVHTLKIRFCSQPPPKLVTWQWGSNQIRAAENINPKYEALPLETIIEHGIVTNCFWAKLEIKNLQKEDARIYTLLVQSEKGEDSARIKLLVKDSTETRMIGVTVIIGLLLVLTLILIGVWSLVRWRRRRYRQGMEEDGSIAADALYNNGATMDRQKTINSSTHVKTFGRKPSLDSDQSAYDYSHVVKQARTMSPEALKVRRAPMVLQSPTIV
ncbi:hemicentin-1 [Harpegnathos saltator]|uniref:Irregular chiasm C-roughest protein n=1 Tax=Harpegnathos saltator TaxID=610380 RepID=E2C9R4_HARSA|nr:hemicentin-1 [Harpegnathos saltator]EFN75304.1 Irregular chiasm C-roughest protein [Harpegnathos saltator]